MPTKRPTAGEIVELLYSNPRLVSPCIDVPLASVQIERSDELELISKPRNLSGSVSQKSRPHLSVKKTQESNCDDTEYSSSAYSPMHGPMTLNPTPERDTAGLRDPLIEDRQWDTEEYSSTQDSYSFLGQDSSPYMPAHVGSYVPPGYIALGQYSSGRDCHRYRENSLSSV